MIALVVSTTNFASDCGSSRRRRRVSIWASRAGAHLLRKQTRISRKSVKAERSGDGVGDKGEDNVSSTEWFAGRIGVKATKRSS